VSRDTAGKETAAREAATREAAAKEAAAKEAAAKEAAAKEAAAKEAAAKDTARYVVQVGAFTDSGAARETRRKVERLGLKTHTQVTETPQGSRIRVRVGPFASREEADRALARLKAAGSPAVVLTL
jgi:DedD protein